MRVEESLWPDPEPVDEIGLMPPTAGSTADAGLVGADDGFGSGAAQPVPAVPDDGDDHSAPPDDVPEPEYDDEHVEHAPVATEVPGAAEPEDDADDGAVEADGAG